MTINTNNSDMDHAIRDEIIKKLMHNPGMMFTDLWGNNDDKIRSNKFAYHLKMMVEADLIEKKEEKYYLSSKGKSFAVFIDGETGKKEKQPLINLILLIYNGDKILLHHRLKEPFYGYYGFPGAKLRFGEEIKECALRELKEETNLKADVKLVGIMNCHTYNNKKLAYHHTQLIIKCTNPKGKLKGQDREGTYEWATKKEVLSKKLFPDDPFIVEEVEKNKFFVVEMDRFQENDEFKDIKYKEVTEYEL